MHKSRVKLEFGLSTAALVEASRSIAELRGSPRNGRMQECILSSFLALRDSCLVGVDTTGG